MKNITFKADDRLIEIARLKAKKENRSLNDIFNEWLSRYTYPQNHKDNYKDNYKKIMHKLSYVDSGQNFSRDEMNER